MWLTAALTDYQATSVDMLRKLVRRAASDKSDCEILLSSIITDAVYHHLVCY